MRAAGWSSAGSAPAGGHAAYKGERFNGATHLAGLGLAVAASGALLSRAATVQADAVQLTACAVFAASMIAVYASSVLFHWTRGRRRPSGPRPIIAPSIC